MSNLELGLSGCKIEKISDHVIRKTSKDINYNNRLLKQIDKQLEFSKTNKLQSSKPCNNCIKIMESIPDKKGYKIQNIYYSNSDGNIVKTNLANLKNDDQHYSRYYRNCVR